MNGQPPALLISLQGGLGIINPIVRMSGSIGLIARDPLDGSPWIVSCHHVLIRPPRWLGPAHQAPESIELEAVPGVAVARTEADRFNAILDCAAARIDLATAAPEGGIDSLGPLSGELLDPVRDMLVVKVGAATKRTEGRIVDIDNDGVRIEHRLGTPPTEFLTDAGDSGAIWLEEGSMKPVALHRRGNSSGIEFSQSSPIRDVLHALRLMIA